MKPAIAFLELSSIARGIYVVDAMVKKAPIEMLASGPVSTGKYTILIGGDVAEIEESYRIGLELADQHLCGHVFLPQVADAIIPGLKGQFATAEPDSLGIIETRTLSSTIIGCDAALKAAEVTLVDLRIYKRLGGKGYFSFTGSLDQVEAAVESGITVATPEQVIQTEIIARPHDESWQHFYGRPTLSAVRGSHRYLDEE